MLQPDAIRIPEINYFMLYGFDVKIDPNGRPWLIEINGINSGLEGFWESSTGLQDLYEDMGSFTLEERIATGLDQEDEGINQPKELLLHTLRQLVGQEDMRQLCDYIETYNIYPGRLADSIGWEPSEKDQRLSGFDDEIAELGAFIAYHEMISKVKLMTDFFFWGPLRPYKPVSYPLNQINIRRLIEDYNPKYIIIKPVAGSLGKDISIVRPDFSLADADSEGMMAEPFIPSKKIWSPKDGQFHDGCMRFVILIMLDKKNALHTKSFGGYWRLSPAPISDYGTLEAMRANKFQGAICQKASREDIDLVDTFLHGILPDYVFKAHFYGMVPELQELIGEEYSVIVNYGRHKDRCVVHRPSCPRPFQPLFPPRPLKGPKTMPYDSISSAVQDNYDKGIVPCRHCFPGLDLARYY